MADQDDSGKNTDDGAGAGDGQNDGDGKPTEPEKQFSQADVDRIVTDRLAREKEKSQRASQRAKEAAEAQALADQKEFEKLAEKRGQKVSGLEADLEERGGELEIATNQVERLTGALNTLLKAQREGLHEYIIPLLDKMDPVDQLDYLVKNRELLMATTEGGGVPASPKPKGATTKLSDDDRRKQSVDARSYM